MPTLTTISSLLDAVQNELRIPTSNTNERAKIADMMSFVYGDICAKQDWWWLRNYTVINTAPKITAGTVNVTEGSTSITFSTAPQRFSSNVSVAGNVIVIPGSPSDPNAAYRIVSHTSGALAATLDAEFTGETDTTAGYTVYKIAYDLPANLAKLMTVKRFGYLEPLQRIGIEDLSYLRSWNTMEGAPQYYSIFNTAIDITSTTASDGSTVESFLRQIQVHPYPDQAYRMEIWYKLQQSGDVESDCDLPLDYQQALVYGTLSRCYSVFMNDTERGAYFLNLFNDVMALMAAQQREYTDDHPGIKIDMRGYRKSDRRGRHGAVTLGVDWFGRLPFQP